MGPRWLTIPVPLMPQQGHEAGSKTCNRCLTALPRECFAPDPQKRDGRYPTCRLCKNGAHLKITHWRGCLNCGRLFKPRRTKDGYVNHCSQACAGAALSGVRSPTWKGNKITYGGAHQRVRKSRGHSPYCEHCGHAGAHWALDHERCAQPLESAMGPYSPDPDDYIRLCVSCHKQMDLSRLSRASQ